MVSIANKEVQELPKAKGGGKKLATARLTGAAGGDTVTAEEIGLSEVDYITVSAESATAVGGTVSSNGATITVETGGTVNVHLMARGE